MTKIYINLLQKEIIKSLECNGPMTRADLVKSVDKPRTTVYDNAMKLVNNNIVKKYVRQTNCRGRPLTFWKIVEEE